MVEHENKEYLHFSMDENFYNFLIDVYNLKKASNYSDNEKKMAEAFEKAIESLKENFSDSSKPKEYVLIPVDDMIEIANDNIPKRKNLAEVVKVLDLYAPTK